MGRGRLVGRTLFVFPRRYGKLFMDGMVLLHLLKVERLACTGLFAKWVRGDTTRHLDALPLVRE